MALLPETLRPLSSLRWIPLWVLNLRPTILSRNRPSSTRDNQNDSRVHEGAQNSAARRRIRFLASCLNCQEAEIRIAVHKYPRLLTMRAPKLRQILSILQSEGITKDEMLTYPDVFTHSSHSLNTRIQQLKDLDMEKIKVASLRESSRLYDSKIRRILSEKESETPYESKEELISSKLLRSLEESKRLLQDYNLNPLRLSTLKSKFDLLEENSVPLEILKDKVWLLRFPVDVLECRLNTLRSCGLNHENCSAFVHLLTCEARHFARRLHFHREERSVLGQCKDKSEYLQKRLGCDEETIVTMVKRNHKLLSTNAPKLKAHLDFLLEKYSPDGLIQFPRIFNFAVDTVKSRYEELVDLGVEFGVKELALETKSYKQFIEYRRKL